MRTEAASVRRYWTRSPPGTRHAATAVTEHEQRIVLHAIPNCADCAPVGAVASSAWRGSHNSQICAVSLIAGNTHLVRLGAAMPSAELAAVLSVSRPASSLRPAARPWRHTRHSPTTPTTLGSRSRFTAPPPAGRWRCSRRSDSRTWCGAWCSRRPGIRCRCLFAGVVRVQLTIPLR